MDYITTKLQSIKSYPTFQFYSEAVSDKLSSSEIFRICILETFKWLRSRMNNFEELPEDILTPEPNDFSDFPENSLHSFSFSNGLSFEVIYIEKKGMWSFRLSETDMGANKGTDFERPAVSGRMFITEFSFLKQKESVEVGVRTICSEPSECTVECEVFRPTVVKAIAENKNIRFRNNGISIDGTAFIISSNSDIEHFCSLVNSENNNFPILLIAESPYEEAIKKPDIPPTENKRLSFKSFSLDMGKSLDFDLNLDKIKNDKLKPEKIGKKSADDTKKIISPIFSPAPTAERKKLPEIDYSKLSKSLLGFAMVFYADEKNLKKIGAKLKMHIENGDIIVFIHGTESERYTYSEYGSDIKNFYWKLRAEIQMLPKRRSYSFGNVLFHSDVKLHEYRIKRHETSSLEEQCDIYRLENTELKKQILEYSRQNTDMQLSAEELRNTQKQLRKIQSEFEILETKYEALEKEMQSKDSAYQRSMEMIEFYKSLADTAAGFPLEQEGICDWTEANFSENILLAPRAKSEIRKYSGALDINVLCDGILYINAYSEFKKNLITKEKLDMYAEKNHWEAGSCGKETLKHRQDDYTFTYENKKRIMDMHIKHGVRPDMLIRIYFCWDDELGKAVIGSMPKHLSTTKQNT